VKRSPQWLVVVVACVVACGCAGTRRLASTFDEARLAARRGELSDARTLADRGVWLTQRNPDSEWAWKFRLLRGEILLLQNQPSEVEAIVRAPMPAGAPFDPLRARQKYLEALLQRSRKQFADALATLDGAQRVAAASADTQLDIAWLGGQIRLRLGQWAEGEAALNAVAARAAAGGNRFQEARALDDLGMGGIVRARWDEALPRFERVLSFDGIDSLSVYATALTNAGICYSRLGQFDRALAVQRRSVALHTTRGTRADFEQALGVLGNTYWLEGDARQALPFMRQALTVAIESNLAADAALWAGNLASANIELGDWDEADRANGEARRLTAETHAGNPLYLTLNAAQIAQGRGRLDEAARLFDDALAGAADDPIIRWAAHAGLARVGLAEAQPDRAARHFDAALETIEKTRSDLLKTEYKLTFLTRLIRFYQAYVDALVDQGRIDRALEISESSRGRVLAERNGRAAPPAARAASIREVAARSHTVLLSYWLGAARSYVWIVTGAGIQCVRLPGAGEIEGLVRAYQDVIGNALADPIAAPTAGDRLYQLLVEPVRPWLPAGARVVIVPDGALHGINFETLTVPGPRRHYWIEDREIETAPSLAMLAREVQSPRAASLLLIGDPAPHNPEFPALTYAGIEMANVSKHFAPGRVTAFEGVRASPAAYRTAGPDRFAFIHFTAHAAPNVQSPLDSAVILSGPAQAFKLYARDVADVPLGADLVTVSACRSAGERAYSGEGLVGFAWAFLHAGASRVIAGLWDVDDRSTAELMDRLYSRITQGDSPAQALREAKLALLARGGTVGKPYYWGPFQLFTVVP
jgi:tetratricopeptide (TPR) repeat protein